MLDLGFRLRELRLRRNLLQSEVAQQSGVGEKTISSFETGGRIEAMKVSQLRRLLRVYRMTECEFFAGILCEDYGAGSEHDDEIVERIGSQLRRLPVSVRHSLLDRFRLMVDTASQTHAVDAAHRPYERADSADWQMLTSRN